MLGQKAVEVWILSHYDANVAYAHWSFSEDYLPAWPSFNIDFLIEILAICVIGPLAEEIFFRGVLLKSLLAKYKNVMATSILAVIFVLAHPKHPHVVATIVFSAILSSLYIRTGSLKLCWIAHGTFNLTALIMENFLWSWFLRSQEMLNATENWRNFYIIFIFSALGIAYFYNYAIKSR